MIHRFRRSAGLVWLALLASCATPPPLTGVARRIAGANEIYLAQVVRSNGYAHTVLLEVWRHDPLLAPPPRVGAEVMTPRPEGANTVEGQVIIYTVPSPGNTPVGGTMTLTTPVVAGRLLVGDYPVDLLRSQVEAGKPDHELGRSPYPPPGLAETLADAVGIYLADLDYSSGTLGYRLREIWRHDSRLGPPPAPGLLVFPFRLSGPGPGPADQVVLFDRSARPLEAGRPVPPGRQAFVVQGYVPAFRLSLADLRAAVAAGPRPALAAHQSQPAEASAPAAAPSSPRKERDYFPDRHDLAQDSSFARALSFVPPQVLVRSPHPPVRNLAPGHYRLRLLYIIETDGAVREVAIKESSGDAALDASYAEMVKRWKFAPAKVDGHPIPFLVEMPVQVDR